MKSSPSHSDRAGDVQLSSATQRILVVDDEPAILFAYCKMIERKGIEVDICECLAAALSHIRTRPYSAVIADLRLAGSDSQEGLEIVSAIREMQPATRIILATGCSNREIEQVAWKLGITHYFEKPVHPADILGVLQDLFD